MKEVPEIPVGRRDFLKIGIAAGALLGVGADFSDDDVGDELKGEIERSMKFMHYEPLLPSSEGRSMKFPRDVSPPVGHPDAYRPEAECDSLRKELSFQRVCTVITGTGAMIMAVLLAFRTRCASYSATKADTSSLVPSPGGSSRDALR